MLTARPSGNTALVLAAQSGHSETIQALVELGCDPNHESLNGMTPLIVASYKGHKKVAELEKLMVRCMI